MFVEQRQHAPSRALFSLPDEPGEEGSEDVTDEDSGSTLEDAARDERRYVRERLREELEREPTDQEIDDWLRKHTEGY